jgi:hypothetical protein
MEKLKLNTELLNAQQYLGVGLNGQIVPLVLKEDQMLHVKELGH